MTLAAQILATAARLRAGVAVVLDLIETWIAQLQRAVALLRAAGAAR